MTPEERIKEWAMIYLVIQTLVIIWLLLWIFYD